jgi:type III secretory pathway component EscR
MNTLLELIKILVPASVVLYAVYLMVRTFIGKEIELKKIEVRGRSIETVLPIRLQAYERITLFLERIAPQALIFRLSNPTYSAQEFHRILLDEIRNEYNHNVSQQVYMSEYVWNMVKNAKEELTASINEVASTMNPDSKAIDLSRQFLQHILDKKEDTFALALSELKKEIQQTF